MPHGGDVYTNKGIKLDFSVSLNPEGPPGEAVKAYIDTASDLCSYPDPCCRTLKAAISQSYNVNKDHIFCTNGASEALSLVTGSVSPSSVLLPVPCFTGYERILSGLLKPADIRYLFCREEDSFAPGAEMTSLRNLSEQLPDMAIFCNPVSPSGKLLSSEFIREYICELLEEGVFVLMDECFLRLTPGGEELSLAALTERYDNLAVVDAFTKRFSMPGLRSGFIITGDSKLMDVISARSPEWNVSLPAQAVSVACLSADPSYMERSLEVIGSQREFIQCKLKKKGYKVVPGKGPFILFKGQAGLMEKLMERKILIRDCADFRGLGSGWYRVGIRKHEDNRILIDNMPDAVF